MSKATGISCRGCGAAVTQSGTRGRTKHYCSGACRYKATKPATVRRIAHSIRRRDPEYRLEQRLARYGISLERGMSMMHAQDWTCAICRIAITWNTMHIDHDQRCCPFAFKGTKDKACGRCVRGFLCPTCNVGLGSMHDDVDVLSRAIAYLTLHDASPLSRERVSPRSYYDTRRAERSPSLTLWT